MEKFKIWDSVTTIDLLTTGETPGVKFKGWNPNMPAAKGGGVRTSSPLAWGSQLVLKEWEDAVETITLEIVGSDADDKILRGQELRRLLQKAEAYWIASWQDDPVVLEVQDSCETNTRYAIIKSYTTPNDSDPFISPFEIDGDFVLTLTHAPWADKPPFEKTCVQLSTAHQREFLTSETLVPTVSDDDAWVNHTSAVISLAGQDLIVGGVGNSTGFGIRFRNLAISPGSTVLRAYLRLVYSFAIDYGPTPIIIDGEANVAPALFTTYANYVGRTRTTASRAVTIPEPAAAGNVIDITDLEDIIQEIIDLPGWAGPDLVIFAEKDGNIGTQKRFASIDHLVYTEPQLIIEYVAPTPLTYGETTPSCDYNYAKIANYQRYRNLDLVYYYDASVPAFSANLVWGGGVARDLLPAVPAVGDILYVGVSISLSQSQHFMSVVFDLLNGSQFNGVWEYYNGAWIALNTTQAYTDTSSGLLASGKNGVFFDAANVPGWVTVAINGQTAYWIRFRVTAVWGVPVPPQQQTTAIYTVAWPHVQIDETQVLGDIPARARTQVNNSREDSVGPTPQRVICALRSLSRGDDFQMWLNARDTTTEGDNPWIIPSVSAGWNPIAPDLFAPTNRSIQWNPAGASSGYFRFRIDSPVSLSYQGKFRILVRLVNTSGFAGTTLQFFSGTSYLNSYGFSLSPYYYGLTTPVLASTQRYQIIDLGVHDLPAVPVDKAEDVPDGILVGCNIVNTAANPNVTIYDMCVLPVDEFVTEIVVPSTVAATIANFGSIGTQTLGLSTVYGYGRLDSLWTKRSVLGGLYLPTQNKFLAAWQSSSAGFHGLQANADQEQYFLAMQYKTTAVAHWYANPFIHMSVQDWALYQYLMSRGAR